MSKTSKRISKIVLLIVMGCLVVAYLTGCAPANKDNHPLSTNSGENKNGGVEQNNTGDVVAMLKPYDDFGCASGNQMQYKLDIDDGRVKVESYYYTGNDDHDNDFYLDVSTAKVNGTSIIFTKITNENGQDVSGQFNAITFTPNGNSVTMVIERKDGGGSAGDLIEGTYNLTPINSDAYDRHDD